jgi:hypothetical protein
MNTGITSKDQRHSVNLTTLEHTGTMPQDTVKTGTVNKTLNNGTRTSK